MKIILYILFALLDYVYGHGYVTFPIARQRRCNVQGGFWWPPNGDGIPDPMCRAAYKYVYNKVYQATGSVDQAANAGQYMFVQDNEYAALAGPNYSDICHIKEDVVPNYLCAAGADNFRVRPFGDKTGMDVVGSWNPTVIPLQDNFVNSIPVELEFCPTAIHEPSYFEVYITDPGFNVYRDKVVWPILTLIFNNTVPLQQRRADSLCNANQQVYRFTVVVPYRQSQFVLYVRWQRNDPVGEGFYNCVDAVFEPNSGPDPEDQIPDPDCEYLDNDGQPVCAFTTSNNNHNRHYENRYRNGNNNYKKNRYGYRNNNHHNKNKDGNNNYNYKKWEDNYEEYVEHHTGLQTSNLESDGITVACFGEYSNHDSCNRKY